MQTKANGINLEYDQIGPSDGVPLLLIRGLGSQMMHWTDELLSGFADKNYRVTIFDNRDVGLSARCPADGVADSAAEILEIVNSGGTPDAAYSLQDMAEDVLGLMDNLSIEKAHIVGMSMGGGITQILLTNHADRLLSATIIMSAAQFPGPHVLEQLVAYPETREQYQDTFVKGNHDWGCSKYPISDDDVREEAGRAFDRGYDPEGVNRQALATMHSEDRREALKNVKLPCLVIHGSDDALIPPIAGQEIAHLIPGAQFQQIDGMGHSITPLLSPVIVSMVDAFIRDQADQSSA